MWRFALVVCDGAACDVQTSTIAGIANRGALASSLIANLYPRERDRTAVVQGGVALAVDVAVVVLIEVVEYQRTEFHVHTGLHGSDGLIGSSWSGKDGQGVRLASEQEMLVDGSVGEYVAFVRGTDPLTSWVRSRAHLDAAGEKWDGGGGYEENTR